ncbi:MAG: S8 family serine peptidase [Clostridia bacterium]|nr:S8 family serine peptidase [Clostridia bacterium]
MKFLRRLSSVFLTAVLAFGTAAPAMALSSASAEKVAVLVETSPGTEAAEVLSSLPGSSLLCEYSLIDAFAAEIPAGSIRTLAAHPGVTDVSLSASFTAPLAGEESAVDPSVIVARDLVLRSADPHAGEGTVIAVLDSGFDATHPVFVLPAETDAKLTKENLAKAAEGTLAWRMNGKSTEGLYINEKIPFAFDYSGADTNVSGNSAHGTHVAASAAGSDTGRGEISGTAPGAQLLLMKVFDDAGQNCTEHALISAIEDAVKLGADILNLSLGTLAYSGADYSMRQTAKALQAAEESGVLVVCATGNDGRAGSQGLSSNMPRALDPDYGLPSEPAVIPGTLAVASFSNSVVYSHYLECADNFIFYDEAHEVSTGETDAFSEVMRGKKAILRVLGGIGLPEDYENIDVQDAVVLVQRGVITFGEKARNAADAGACAVIVYDTEEAEPFLMSLEGAGAVPTVSVSHKDGTILAGLDNTEIIFSQNAKAFPSADSGMADYSSWGPTADLLLKPEIAAAGSSVISAVPGGGYNVMSGTSMASPQIAGMAARLLSEYRDLENLPEGGERVSLWKAALMSLAEPLTGEDGLPLSPRGQGAGILRQTDAQILLQNTDNSHAIHIGEQAEKGFSFRIKLTNLTDKAQTRILRVPLITDAAKQDENGVWYITGTSERVPAALTVTGAGVTFKNGTLRVALEPSAERELTVSLKPSASFVEQKLSVFENGFYLEGFVILEKEDGTHEASLPYLAFAGDWEAAPMIDALDWDGEVSYYGMNRLIWDPDAESVLGETTAGVFSSLFAFSPNRDGSADLICFDHAPLRNIAEMHIEILQEDGKVLYTSAEYDLLKAISADGKLVYNTVRLWDGSDGINDHFHWQDGSYTVQLTLVSYTGGGQLLYIPIRIDTEKPANSLLEEKDGVLRAAFTDNHALKELRIYLPGEDGEFVLDERISPKLPEAGEISAALPEGAEYVYVSAEDYAGNKNILRFWIHG